MRIKISSDSTCDLSPEIIEKYDIGIIPLYIVKNGESFRDGIEIKPRDIFDYVDGGKGSCSTAAVNVTDYIDYFGRWQEEFDAIIHINLSSEISICYQNASIAAKEMKNTYVIDSKQLSTGSGLIVLEAAKLAEEGMQPQYIKAELDRKADLVETSFVLDTLKYLHRGGRCSAIQALGANLMSLKPCIDMEGGVLKLGKKYRGPIQKCLIKYIEDKLAGRTDIDYSRVFITNADVSAETLHEVRRAVEIYGRFGEIIETSAGCTISNHCGPNCLGIIFARK